jgi:hypothetical protein
MNYAADPIKRAAILDAEQKRLDYLREHTHLPVLEWGEEMIYPACSSDEVDAVAAATGQPVEELAAGCRVILRFGAGVSYVAIATEQAQSAAVAA